jgi:hypothetical protein
VNDSWDEAVEVDETLQDRAVDRCGGIINDDAKPSVEPEKGLECLLGFRLPSSGPVDVCHCVMLQHGREDHHPLIGVSVRSQRFPRRPAGVRSGIPERGQRPHAT